MFAYQDRLGCVKRTNGTWWCVLRTLLLLAFMAALVGGCGGERGPERVVVSGTVTYQGKPIPDGTIRFAPAAGAAVPTIGATIVAGKYRVDAKGGVPVGTFIVQIEAYRSFADAPQPDTASPAPPKKFEIRDQYIPDKFNANSGLKVVVPSGSNQITKDFDLKN